MMATPEEITTKIINDFEVDYDGVSQLKNRLGKLNRKWFLVYNKKIERDFLKQLIPALEKLQKEFEDKLTILLKTQQNSFLKYKF